MWQCARWQQSQALLEAAPAAALPEPSAEWPFDAKAAHNGIADHVVSKARRFSVDRSWPQFRGNPGPFRCSPSLRARFFHVATLRVSCAWPATMDFLPATRLKSEP